jgi:hypothetical protein
MDGDAAMIHMITLIDKGIHSRLRDNMSEERKKWRNVYKYL